MGIDEDIKQMKWQSLQQKVNINIMFTANWIADKTRESLKPFSITHQQFNVLKILKGKHPAVCAAQDIKEVMLDKSPDLTRLLDRLIDKGLIKRSTCEDNRRKLDIAITREGLDLVNKIVPRLSRKHSGHRKITDKEANELNRILDKIRK